MQIIIKNTIYTVLIYIFTTFFQVLLSFVFVFHMFRTLIYSYRIIRKNPLLKMIIESRVITGLIKSFEKYFCRSVFYSQHLFSHLMRSTRSKSIKRNSFKIPITSNHKNKQLTANWSSKWVPKILKYYIYVKCKNIKIMWFMYFF